MIIININKFFFFPIGAGAGGSSASYWLKETFVKPNSSVWLNFNATIYEKSSIVGRRAKVVNFESNDGEKFNIELGAALFADNNYHIIEAAKKFGLESVYYGEEVPDTRAGM